MESVLAGLRAAAEPTRLRLLALCARTELTVSELTAILGQSQPRVSRHLKLLCEAGLLDRLVPDDDPIVALDRERLDQIKRARAESAAAYFRANAAQWGTIRSLYVDESEVERALLDLIPAGETRELLDIGTGTGRMLEILAPRAEHAVGVDTSREMLTIARVNLERAGMRNCSIRRGDMYQLPLAGASFDTVVIHQVLH